MRALILEDDERLRGSLSRALTRTGLACDEAATIAEAEELLDLHSYDLLLLDRRVSDGDGLSLCTRARRNGFANSILMVTAMDDSHSTVEGLAEGADDYIGKPFDLDVLEARVKALMRRNERRPTTELVVGDLVLNPWKRSVLCNGSALPLTAREFRILETMMRAPDAIISREDLLEHAWGEREEPMSNTVDVLIGRLRKKIDVAGSSAKIETVRGMGYRVRA
ncbi:MAG: response regulator transcription factor [Acidobacteriota bacterium]